VPGTGIRFGLDGMVGLIPGIGDSATALISLWFVLEGARLGLPKRKLARMLLNIGLDTAVGAIPVLGDVFDLAWKANRRNYSIIAAHFARS
jgi:hypothetical protein